MSEHGRLEWKGGATGLVFEARFDPHATTFDSGRESVAINPAKMLLAALATCEAMDVISILRKKRLDVTSYVVEVSGERAPATPRRYVSIALLHRVTGHAIPEAAVADAVHLGAKYCTVRHSLDPALPIEERWEVVEG